MDNSRIMRLRGIIVLTLPTLMVMPALAEAAQAQARTQETLTSVPAQTPTHGMTMAEVRTRFGPPERRPPPDPATAQGPLKPPIVRWIYPHFTVYFERGLVIHTVWTHPRRAPAIGEADGG